MDGDWMKITSVTCIYKSELREKPHKDRNNDYQNKYLLKHKTQISFKSVLIKEISK